MHLDDQLLRGLSVLINRMVRPREARGGAESCAHTENTIGAAEHDVVPDAGAYTAARYDWRAMP